MKVGWVLRQSFLLLLQVGFQGEVEDGGWEGFDGVKLLPDNGCDKSCGD